MKYMQHLSESEDLCAIGDAAYQIYAKNCDPKEKDKSLGAIKSFIENEGKILSILRNKISSKKQKNSTFTAGMYAKGYAVPKGNEENSAAMVVGNFNKVIGAVDREYSKKIFKDMKAGHIEMSKTYMDFVKKRLKLAKDVVSSVKAKFAK